jgi:hypothetical protein
MTDRQTKFSLHILTKKEGQRHWGEWKLRVKSECDKTEADDAYLLADGPSEHLTKSIPKPLQSSYQKADGSNNIQLY